MKILPIILQNILLVCLMFINIRLLYVGLTDPPYKEIFHDVVLGRDTVIKDYMVINKKDTVLKTEFNSSIYPYLSEKRNITFDHFLNADNSVGIYWWIWYDGEIIESGSKTVFNTKVRNAEEELKIYASKRIQVYSTIK